MAEFTVSSLASADNPVHYEINGRPAVSSREIALKFQRKHKTILQDIARIISMCPESFTGQNFLPSEYTDITGRRLPCYLLTRDAFSLLAMGFTGKAAIQWKLKYIEAFNALEQDALTRAVDLTRQAALAELPAERARAAREALGLSELDKKRMTRAVKYRQRGFTQQETATVMGVHRRTVQNLLRTAKTLGLEA